MKTTALCLVLLASFSVAQDKPKAEPAKTSTPAVAPLTEQEKLTLKTDQSEMLKAISARDKTAEQQAVDYAAQLMNKDVNDIYATRKLTNTNDFVLCDGPGSPACVGLGKGELALRPAVKPDVKK